jgi:1-acyl-sn-glycerol-3-phosphate acyltransferase
MTEEIYQLKLFNQAMRPILRPFFRGLFHLLSQVHIYGSENVPTHGAYLIVINHISLFEPPFVMAFWPTAPEAVGAVDIWDKAGQSTLARMYGGIPVRRGEYDRKLIKTLLQVLKSGRPLLIAPEGSRSHTPGMRRGLPGAAYLAVAGQVPVIPTGIVGTSDDFLKNALRGQRGCLEMHIGQPFRLPAIHMNEKNHRESRQYNSDLIMRKIAELLPPEYHGVYAVQAESDHSNHKTSASEIG